MTIIYLASCNCGIKNVYTTRVKSNRPGAVVINSKLDMSRLKEHLAHQKSAGLGGTPVDIVVENGNVVRLIEWKS